MFRLNGHSLGVASTFILCILAVCAQAQRRDSAPSPPPPQNGAANAGVNKPPESAFPTGHLTARAEGEGPVLFKSETVLIQIPVVVVDKSGNHVTNLKKEDFLVQENGKDQKVATFEEVVADKSRGPAPKTQPGEFSNLAAKLGEQPRAVTVIALDTVNTPFLDQGYARKELLKFLAQNLDSNQIIGLVLIGSHGLKVVQGLTDDTKSLIEALNKVSGELPAITGVDLDTQVAAASLDILPAKIRMLHDFEVSGDVPLASFRQESAIETTMQAFLGIAWSLSGVPGKKSLIWATGGMPFYLDSPSTVPGAHLSNLYERAMAALNESNISVYPVDVRGLFNDMPVADQRRMISHGPSDLMRQTSNRAWLTFLSQDTLNEFAAMTGGKAFYSSNDISNLFKRAVDDSSSYYLVGYYLDTKNTKAGWRQLKIKVRGKEKGAEVRTRTGFLVTNATVNPDVAKKSDMDLAIISPFDSTGLPLTVRWLGTSADVTTKKVQFGLQLPSDALALGSKNLLNFDYVAFAYITKDGKQVNGVSKTIRGNISPDLVAKFRERPFGLKDELALGPGQYTVRFVVRDDVSGKVGSVSAPLTVN